jgi:hypothetical protein
VEAELPQADTFTVGSKPGAVDVVLPLSQISRTHALCQRDGTWLTIRDQNSRNGQFINGHPDAAIHMTVGQRFRWPPFDLFLLDKELRDLRAQLAFFLTYEDHALVDRKTLLAAQGGHLYLAAAQRTCQPAALARELHKSSGRRGEPFRVLDVRAGLREADIRPVFAQAARGTIYLDLLTVDDVPDFLAQLLFGDEFGVRSIVSGANLKVAQRKLLHYAAFFDGDIEVPAVSARRQDAPRMLDELLDQLGSSQRVARLGVDRVAALAAYDWPEDIAQLRRSAERIHAYLENGSMTAAAKALGVKVQTLHKALHKIGAVTTRPAE